MPIVGSVCPFTTNSVPIVDHWNIYSQYVKSDALIATLSCQFHSIKIMPSMMMTMTTMIMTITTIMMTMTMMKMAERKMLTWP